MSVNTKTLERLGTAVDLIENHQFAPMFRNRQINYPELFAFSEQLARKKNHPGKYFAKIWGKKQLKKTIAWLTKLVNQAKAKAAAIVNQKREQRRMASVVAHKNQAGLDKITALKRSYNLIS